MSYETTSDIRVHHSCTLWKSKCAIINCNLDHNPILPFILRVLKITCIVTLQCEPSTRTGEPAFTWTLVDGGSVVFHDNSLIHQTSPTYLHTHCRSIKISRNSGPQDTWSSSISMPDLLYFPSPWAVQLQQLRCILALPQVPQSLLEGLHGKLPATRIP